MIQQNEVQAPFTPMLQGVGYEAHHQYSERMEVTQYHCHDYYELYLHVQGGEYMGVDNKLFQLKPNQMFLIPPFYMHGLSCTDEMKGYERAYLNLSPEVLNVLGCRQINLGDLIRACAARGQYTYQLDAEQGERFVRCVKGIQDTMRKEMSPAERFQHYAEMIRLLSMICQVMGQEETEQEGIVTNSIIQEVLAWINTHYTDDLNVHALARRFNVSVSFLSHEFSRFTNRGIYDYIIYRRVMLSRQMMLGEESLNSIAYRCGFNDYSNYLRSFSKLMGMSPSRYRKELRRFKNRET